MKRYNNMGMGGRGGVGGGGGPLMTDHLQDLELELELLKRKRQLIQQQQSQILHQPNVGQATYNPPRQMYEAQFDAPPRRDFSHLYEAPPQEARPFAPKRRPVPVWDNAPGDRPAVPNKRPRSGPFPPTRHMDNKPPLQPPRPAPLQSLLGPKPLMGFAQVAPKGQGSRPRTFQTKFKHNAKPPVPKIPKFIPKKQSPNKPTPNKPSNDPAAQKLEKESFILTADVKPRSKVLGRLEFALGIILKEMKAAFNDTDERIALFVTTSLARIIKQAIRDRLRTVMLGKYVGAGPEVVAEYRKAYPPSTDADIVKLAEVERADQEQKGQMAIELLEEGDPELYFKKNVTKLLEVKLDEMFQKIEKSYENGSEKSEIVENLPEVQKAPTEDSLKFYAVEVTDNLLTKKHPKEDEYDKWMSLLLERKLPQLLSKHKQDIIKVLDLDKSFRATKAAIIMNANNKSLHIAKASDENFSKIPEPSKDDPVLPQNLSYFAKVHASPMMPKRKPMQDFLNQFNPQTIKRHKKNYNLLFVGFNNKKDYDRMLKADQTIIGPATITIMGNAPKTEQSAVIEIKDEDSIDQVLTPQLDDQINDLLSSIRKADEEVTDGTNGEAKPEDVAVEENATAQKQITDGSDSDVQEVNADAEVVAIEDDEVAAESDAVGPLPSEGAEPAPATPAKSKAPATPSTIRTRRASRLAQNN